MSDEGRTAFPVVQGGWVDYGLTQRELFAAMAMQGYISAGSNGMPGPSEIVDLAVRTADALIEALGESDE